MSQAYSITAELGYYTEYRLSVSFERRSTVFGARAFPEELVAHVMFLW